MGPQAKAEHMAAPDQSVRTPKTLLPGRRRPHTALCEIGAGQAYNPHVGHEGDMTEKELYDHLEHYLGIVPARRSPGGEVFHTKPDALRLVEAAREMGFGFLGIEGFRHEPLRIRPQMDMIGDRTQGGMGGPWEEFKERSYRATMRFLAEMPDDTDLIFNIVTEARGRPLIDRRHGS